MGARGIERGGESPDFAVIRCVDWLRQRGLAVNEELWDGIYDIAQTAKRPSVRLRARQMLADRIDPVPRAPAVEINTGPILIRWATESEAPSFPTLPEPSKPSSTPPLSGNGHALPSSSATDDLANL